MCGIVGYLRTPRTIESYDLSGLSALLEDLSSSDSSSISDTDINNLKNFARELIGVNGVISLVYDLNLGQQINVLSEQLKSRVEQYEIDNELNEHQKENIGIIYDALWRISKDAYASAVQIADLVNDQTHQLSDIPDHVLAIYRSINIVLR